LVVIVLSALADITAISIGNLPFLYGVFPADCKGRGKNKKIALGIVLGIQDC
jgi:hypothetical protein